MTDKQKEAKRKSLTKRREKLDISLRLAAPYVGVSDVTLMRWERGDHETLHDFKYYAWERGIEKIEKDVKSGKLTVPSVGRKPDKKQAS